MSALRSYYRFCGRTGRIKVPDLAWLRAPKIPHAVPKPVSEDEARAMLQAIFQRRGDDWAKKRDFALLMLLYGAGLRISEALALTRAALPIGDWLRITGKGGKIREVPVLAAVAEAVTDYVAAEFAITCDAACPATCLCNASSGQRGRSAGHSGIAGPCQPVNNAALYIG